MRIGISREHIVAATLFTTQSVTAVLETIQREIASSFPAPARFDLAPSGTRTVFPLADIASLKFNQQTGANPVAFTEFKNLLFFAGELGVPDCIREFCVTGLPDSSGRIFRRFYNWSWNAEA